MRKVLVCGAAFAATCVSAVTVPVGAHANTPAPTPSASAPSESPTGTPSGVPETGAPGGTGSPTASTAPTEENVPAGPGGEPDGTVTAQAVMVTPELPRFRTYAYGKAPAQKIDAYWRKPGPRATPRPAVLLLHGGYWLEGDKGGGWKYFARRLTDEGFVVLSANYRLAPKAQWPAQRDDALAALDFVKKHAPVWNVDPSRVAVMGSSAGGHLATQLGTLGTGTQQVRGVVALSPPNNPYLAFQDGAKPDAPFTQRKLRRAVVDLLHCVPGATAAPDCWTKLDDASTVTHVSPGDAPMLLMHATGDFVPVTQSTGLASALRGAGVQATVKTVEGDMHASDMLGDEGVYPTILAWLKKRLNP
ncbi:alpha/beta hydrolase [Actinomadura sp. WMMA1423]|uniref:alpha/beta hydrolase n=1 Tax=Actinomadura sp. WMMA1423 TaxID=2591108 RepID=UPI001F0EFD70|nr:alpha/beta hydrolase [Actinomadura sp. WMMA1423]